MAVEVNDISEMYIYVNENEEQRWERGEVDVC